VNGQWLQGDHLVIALGCESRPELVPGLAEHGFNLYDVESVERLAGRLETFRRGRVVLAIAGLPYKCPPAPYEAIMLLDDMFRRRGVRDDVTLTFSTLQPALLPNAGPPGHQRMVEELGKRDIAFHVKRPVTTDAS
jgi:sulfide:quinone oxidoreductase